MIAARMVFGVAFVLTILGQVSFAQTTELRVYSWNSHALCGEFSAKTGDWIRQVDMKLCGGSKFRLYTWREHRLCGEFTVKTGEWISQAEMENCGGVYFKQYAVGSDTRCGEFAKQDDQWVSDVSSWNCESTGTSSGGGRDFPQGHLTSGSYNCASGQAYCNPPEMGGACYCQ